MSNRNSFTFYRSFFEAIKELPEKNQLELYNAIMNYCLDFKEPKSFQGVNKTVWTLIEPFLTSNIRKFENGLKPKEKQAPSKDEAPPKQDISKAEGNKELYKELDKELDKEDNTPLPKSEAIDSFFPISKELNKKEKGKATHEFIAYFCSAYKKKFGVQYLVTGKDSGIAKNIIKSIGNNYALIDQFLETKDKFLDEAGYTIGVFSSRLNKLQATKPKSLSKPEHSILKIDTGWWIDDVIYSEEEGEKLKNELLR